MGFLGVDRDIPIRDAEQYRRPHPPPLRLRVEEWNGGETETELLSPEERRPR